MKQVIKYQYFLHTWGGFYKEEYQKVHNENPGDYWFDTLIERASYIDKLKQIEEKLGAHQLMIDTTEGYCCNIRTRLHRVVKWKDTEYYSELDLGVGYPIEAAKYHLMYQWKCGFNDYPLGEDFPYGTSPLEIIEEWITGAYHIERI